MSRRILITGSSTGIGAATAIRFAEPGATVSVHFNTSRERAKQVAAEVARKGARAILLQGDVSQPAPCEQIVETFTREAGGLDALVNNAGALVRRSLVENIEWEVLEQVFRVNVFSAFYVTKCALPHLKKGNAPCIVNLGSIAARHGAPTATPYGAAKAALHAFTRGLAKEVAPHVRVNAVAPGVIATPFHEKMSTPEMMKNWADGAPLKRNGTPQDVAEAIYYLCSPAASFITGETLDINGGLFMR